jgi:hypothetical protein
MFRYKRKYFAIKQNLVKMKQNEINLETKKLTLLISFKRGFVSKKKKPMS